MNSGSAFVSGTGTADSKKANGSTKKNAGIRIACDSTGSRGTSDKMVIQIPGNSSYGHSQEGFDKRRRSQVSKDGCLFILWFCWFVHDIFFDDANIQRNC